MHQKLILAAITAVIGVLYLFGAAAIRTVQLGDPLGPRVFPILLGIGMLLTCALLLAESRSQSGPEQTEPGQPVPACSPYRSGIIIGAVIVWTTLYFWSFEPLGYVASSTLYLFGLMYAFNGRRWLSSGLIAILFSCVSYLTFTWLLGVRLPAGPLPF